MGAPTGSFEVRMPTWPRETASPELSPRKPVIVTVARRSTDRFLMAAQVWASGVQVRAAACSGVSRGGSFVSPMQRGSISPIFILSPCERARIGAAPSGKVTSIVHAVASLPSRQRKVGARNSGGKTDPSAG